jgi:ribonuclease Z
MKTGPHKSKSEISRRDSMRLSGLALGGLAMGSTLSGPGTRQARAADEPYDPSQQYSYFEKLEPFYPGTPLEDNEMRITFLGSGFPPPRRAQAEMSVFVEVGPWVAGKPDPDYPEVPVFGRATDSFVFDCGSGVATNYSAMNISPARMDKIFINHLHGDHVSGLGHVYWFGPSCDRKSPLYVWGPGPSGVKSPRPPRRLYDDGTRAFCQNLRDAMRWATESFSFQTTAYVGYDTPSREHWWVPDTRGPVSDDPADDAYALIPIELDWTKYGQKKDDNLAYSNPTTKVRITHFPVIHTRKGSVGYRLEWTTPSGKTMSMVYTSDTKPEHHSVSQGSGVDVFIHEMILPADALMLKTMGITDPTDPKQVNPKVWETAVDATVTVQNSSHTPQGAYGYLLSQMAVPPRLAVATHFTVSDDTILGVEGAKEDMGAIDSVRAHVPGIQWEQSGIIQDNGVHPQLGSGQITWSTDLMVIRVFPDKILVQKGVVDNATYQPYPLASYPNQKPPKYDDGDPNTLYGDPYAQIDRTEEILPTEELPEGSEPTFRQDGY